MGTVWLGQRGKTPLGATGQGRGITNLERLRSQPGPCPARRAAVCGPPPGGAPRRERGLRRRPLFCWPSRERKELLRPARCVIRSRRRRPAGIRAGLNRSQSLGRHSHRLGLCASASAHEPSLRRECRRGVPNGRAVKSGRRGDGDRDTWGVGVGVHGGRAGRTKTKAAERASVRERWRGRSVCVREAELGARGKRQLGAGSPGVQRRRPSPGRGTCPSGGALPIGAADWWGQGTAAEGRAHLTACLLGDPLSGRIRGLKLPSDRPSAYLSSLSAEWRLSQKKLI